MKLTKMFTCHGPIYIDADQLEQKWRKCLTIYTARGNRAADVLGTKAKREAASFGVHRNNLFDTLEAAIANREAIYQSIFNRSLEES